MKKDIKKNIMYHLANKFGKYELDVDQKTMTIHGYTYKSEEVKENLEKLRKEGKLSRKIHRDSSSKKILLMTYYIKKLRPSIEKIEKERIKILFKK